MSQITHEQARFLLTTFLTTLNNEHPTTKRVIEAIPTQNSDYRPDPASKTAIELAWHIVAAEKRFFAAITTGAFDFSPIPRPDSARTGADVAVLSDQFFAEGLQALDQLNGEQLVKIIDFRGIIQLPAVYYLQFIINHTIHHRGQLSTYLRAMGGKVPSIYGESYDAAQARQAREAKAS